MFNYTRLRGMIRGKGYTQAQFANKIGLSDTAFSSKLNNKTYFTTIEINSICKVLDISSNDIGQYFFTERV